MPLFLFFSYLFFIVFFSSQNVPRLRHVADTGPVARRTEVASAISGLVDQTVALVLQIITITLLVYVCLFNP